MFPFSQLATTPLTALSGVGKKSQEKLARLDIETARDLILHLPSRYEDKTKMSTIADAPEGERVLIVVEVVDTKIQEGRKRVFLATLKDHTGVMTARYFSYSKGLMALFKPGYKLHCFGEVKRSGYGIEVLHPECKIAPTGNQSHERFFSPVYPLTEGVSNIVMSSLIQKALPLLNQVKESDTPAISRELGLSFVDKIRFLHNPPASEELHLLNEGKHPVQKSLKEEELLAYALSLCKLKNKVTEHDAEVIEGKGELRKRFLESLPFSPTNAQNRVVKEIMEDLSKPHPMMRLVQGDVGSGKTLVAVLAALDVIEQGGQVAIMAPTEILAEQHAETFGEWLEPFGINVGWLAGKTKAKARRLVCDSLISGELPLIVGTHALFQDDVVFKRLNLIVIDEQHRFGVHQRLSLREKGCVDGLSPHQLVMTATPIPRTLAMMAYADLDTSIIDELPPGRTPIKTVAIPDIKRLDVINRIRVACQTENRQVYWVCTLIEESETINSQAAEDTHAFLQEELSELTVGLVHGRMKSKEKQSVMSQFKDGEVDVLVATTVIEVGVNVPNASLMIIENPERLGLAQLHQLRGRVGRGEIASSCVLLYQTPMTPVGSQRISALRESNDGFVIAQRDLEMRGPGELLGTKQTGIAQLKTADLVEDADLVAAVQPVAISWWEKHRKDSLALMSRWQFDQDQYAQA